MLWLPKLITPSLLVRNTTTVSSHSSGQSGWAPLVSLIWVSQAKVKVLEGLGSVGGSRGESVSRLIQVAGGIKFLMVIRLRPCVLTGFSWESHSAPEGHLCSSSWCPLLQTSSSAVRPSHASDLSLLLL